MLKERPYRYFCETWKICDGEQSIWWFTISAKPKHDIQWAYIVIGGKVRWRARVAGYEYEEGEKTFSDGHKVKGKLWILLFDFEQLPRPHQKMKGFRGFRYKFYENDNC